MTQHLYISQIRTVLPNLAFEKLEQISGQFHDIVIINREWIFRFPRYRDGVQRARSEAQLLENLRGRLPLPIPEPVHKLFDPPVPGLALVGYLRLPGQPLLPADLDAVRNPFTRDDLASQLAAFLRAMHNLPLTDFPADFPGCPPGQPAADLRPVWEDFYAQVRQQLYPAMRPDARRAVEVHFEAYLDDPAQYQFIPCLRHGDFGGSNILWDPAAGRITAVLDFSACAPGDPAYDLASISTLGGDLFDRLIASYAPNPADRKTLLARARFYQGTFALQEALDGLREGDRKAYEQGMQTYI